MGIVDDRGRLFGRLNVIDALVLLVVVVLIPVAYGAYVLFRTPNPTIVSIEPSSVVQPPTTVPPSPAPVLTIRGTNLRPYLRARIGTAFTPFLIETTGVAEVKLPNVPPGTYDVELFDEAQQVAILPGALTVLAPPAPPAPPPPSRATPVAVGTIRVRFVAEPEILDVMKVGDVDLADASVPADAERAVLTQIGTDRRTMNAVSSSAGVLNRSFQLEQTVLAFTGMVRVPLMSTPMGWTYKDRPVKVGAAFTFETKSGGMVGTVLELRVQQIK